MITPSLKPIDLSKTVVDKHDSRDKYEWTATHPDINLNKQYLVKFKQNNFFDIGRFYNESDLNFPGNNYATIWLSINYEELEIWEINLDIWEL